MARRKKATQELTVELHAQPASDAAPVSSAPSAPPPPLEVEETPESDGLTLRQRFFVEFYLQSWNATRAAKLAGYSEASARFIGCENLTKPNIKAAIAARMREVAMGTDEVLSRLAAIARGQGAQEEFLRISGEEGVTLALEAAKEAGLLHLVKKFSRTETGTISIEWHDPMRAMELIGRAQALFKERHEHTGADGGPIEHAVTEVVVNLHEPAVEPQ